MLQIVTGAQGKAIFAKLRQPNFLAVNLLIVKFFDAIAGKRMAQSRRKINNRAATVSYFNKVFTQLQRHQDFLKHPFVVRPTTFEMFDVAEEFLGVSR